MASAREFWNGRRFRLGAGGGLIVLAVALAGPRLFSYSSVDAVVNGRIATLQTPIAGSVAAGALRPGQQVAREDLIAVVENQRVDRSFAGELRTERASLTKRIAAIEEQAQGLRRLRGDLDQRRAAYRDATLASLDQEISERRAARAAKAAQAEERESNRARQEQLGQFAARQAIDSARAGAAQTLHELTELDAAVNRLTLQRAQVLKGTYVGNGRNDVPYTEQRSDEVEIQLLDLAARQSEYAARVEEIDLQLKAEQERLDLASRADLAAPFDGVVWRTASPPGSNVVIGSEVAQVLDCRTVFLDVLVAEGRYDHIHPGDEVRYRLLGSGGYSTGKVVAIRGAGLVAQDITLAAQVKPNDKKQFRVWVSLDPADLHASRSNFCQVGRRAEVEFEQRWNLFGRPAVAEEAMAFD